MVEQSMEPPCFVVDFNEMVESDLVLLARGDVRLDASGIPVSLSEGMAVIVCQDDVGEDGEIDRLIARGSVERGTAGGLAAVAKWACRIDEYGVRHESEIENDTDDILFGYGEPTTPDRGDEQVWYAVVRNLVDQLAKRFGQELEIEDDEIGFDDGFCVDFRTGGSDADSLTLRVRGVVGAQVVNDALLVSAWVFLYLGEARLSVEVPGECLYFTYVDTDRGGAWRLEGWEIGEPGEHDAFDWFDG